MDKHLVIGMGEIGMSIASVIGADYMRDVKPIKVPKIDILHIAFPYSEKFGEYVRDYIEEYNPRLTIVYSTTPIGTCEKISSAIVHSPVEGRHPDLTKSISIGVRWLGSTDAIALEMAVELWREHVEIVRTLSSSAYTELLKIRSTAKYGINLVWTDYESKLCDLVGVGFDTVKQFDVDYNDLYSELGEDRFQRYILDPPKGEIGGHCIIPNAELLDEQFPHPMLKMLKKFKKKEGK